MTRPVDDTPVEELVDELRGFLGRSEYRIEQITDLDTAFRIATELANMLQDHQERIAALRGRIAVGIRDTRQLDLEGLAGVITASRSRAYQLWKLGQRSLAERGQEETTDDEPDDDHGRGVSGGGRPGGGAAGTDTVAA